MIIFGTRGVKSTIQSGDFNCPQCARSMPYRHRKVKKFFTLYFIPLIPLGSAGEYVECNGCKGTFIPRVLSNAPAVDDEFMANYERALRHTMVLIMLADGVIEDKEKDTVLALLNKFGSTEISMLQLENYIKKVQSDNLEIHTYLKKICDSLNEHGKETILKCAFFVAAADGNVDDSELKLIQQMGDAMEMAPAHYKGVLNELTTKSIN